MKLKKGINIRSTILKELKKISDIDNKGMSYKYWEKELKSMSNKELEEFAYGIADRSKKVELFVEVGETIEWESIHKAEKAVGVNRYTDVTLRHMEGGNIVQKDVVVLRINIERLKQIAYKKASANVSGVKRYNAITGGDMNKKGVFTIPEIQGAEVLKQHGYIKESILTQGDNPMATAMAKKMMLEDGHVSLKTIEENIVGRPTSAYFIDEHFISAGIIPLINNQVPLEQHVEKDKLARRKKIRNVYGQ